MEELALFSLLFPQGTKSPPAIRLPPAQCAQRAAKADRRTPSCQGMERHNSTGLRKLYRAMMIQVFPLLLISALPTPSSLPRRQAFLGDQDSPVPPQPPSWKALGCWQPWLDHPKQFPSAMPMLEQPQMGLGHWGH